jgi:hypothetical protein
MATNYKHESVQGTAATTTYATLYNTGASTQAVISSIVICNTAAAPATFRVGIMGSAGTPAASDWIIYDAVVQANDTTVLTMGVALGNDEFIRVSSSAITVAFSAFVSEIS